MASSKMSVDTEIREFFRRSGAHPDRKGQLRRDAFKRLLSLAKTPTEENKALAVEFVQDYFADFPDMQDEAINVIYDMCEDQDQEIRIAGYSAITSVSKVERSWLVRNADVLVQLLQIDDANEVAFVKRALQEHVDLDARGTLRVLADQCIYDPATLADQDERDLRARLRNLVLKFLVQKYKICIARAVRDPAVEEILLKAMIEALPRISAAEAHSVVKNILVYLPSLTSGMTQSGDAVLDAVLVGAYGSLSSELAASPSTPSDLKRTILFLSLASFLISSDAKTNSNVPGRVHQPHSSASHSSPANPQRLYRGYITLLSSDRPSGPLSGSVLADRVSPEAFREIFEDVCTTIDLSEKVGVPMRNLKDQFIDKALPSLLTALRKYASGITPVERSMQPLCLKILRYVYDALTKLSKTECAVFRPIIPTLASLETELGKKPGSSSPQGSAIDERSSSSIIIRKIIGLLEQPQEIGLGAANSASGVGAHTRLENNARQSTSSFARRAMSSAMSAGLSTTAASGDIPMRGAAGRIPASNTPPSAAIAHTAVAMDIDDEPVVKVAHNSETQPVRKRQRSEPSEIAIAGASTGKPSLLSRLSGQSSADAGPPRRQRSSGSTPVGTMDAPSDLKSRLGLPASPGQLSNGRSTPTPRAQRDDSKSAQPRPNILRNRLNGGYSAPAVSSQAAFDILGGDGGGEISIRGAAQREASVEDGGVGVSGSGKTSLLERLHMQSGHGGRKRKLGMYTIS